ncbi:MAG TPA: FadR family transcriptional regulator [Microbacterium sp.]|nr:FadR family transcriptional regulator [Microbacterium sp.]HBR89959.1 FadR family transcriptional regulator [Microbacterium sp.]
MTNSDRVASMIFPEEVVSTPNANAIADRISSSISLGLMSVGDRLPTEVELAQQFGVAVATLRKALAVLRHRELVVTHRGRTGGTFIVKAPFPTADEVRRRLLVTSLVELRDMRDEHIAVGTAIARLAASRAWGNSLHRLRDLADQVVSAPTTAESASADSRFHIELAVLSQSTRLMRSEVRIQSEISPLLWSTAELASRAADVHPEHLSIIDAVLSSDSDAAAKVVSDHLQHENVRIMDAKLSMDSLDARPLP